MMRTRVEPTAYWINVGGKQYAGRLERKLEQLKFGITSKAPSGVLSGDSIFDRVAMESYSTQAESIEALMPWVCPARLTHLFGIYSGTFHE